MHKELGLQYYYAALLATKPRRGASQREDLFSEAVALISSAAVYKTCPSSTCLPLGQIARPRTYGQLGDATAGQAILWL